MIWKQLGKPKTDMIIFCHDPVHIFLASVFLGVNLTPGCVKYIFKYIVFVLVVWDDIKVTIICKSLSLKYVTTHTHTHTLKTGNPHGNHTFWQFSQTIATLYTDLPDCTCRSARTTTTFSTGWGWGHLVPARTVIVKGRSKACTADL